MCLPPAAAVVVGGSGLILFLGTSLSLTPSMELLCVAASSVHHLTWQFSLEIPAHVSLSRSRLSLPLSFNLAPSVCLTVCSIRKAFIPFSLLLNRVSSPSLSHESVGASGAGGEGERLSLFLAQLASSRREDPRDSGIQGVTGSRVQEFCEMELRKRIS